MIKLSKEKIKARNKFRKEVVTHLLKEEILTASTGMLQVHFSNHSPEYLRSYYNWLNNMVDDGILNRTNNTYRLSSDYENKFYTTFWTKFVDLFFTSIKGVGFFIISAAAYAIAIDDLLQFFTKYVL